MPRFCGKTVIITGSSNGIGRSAALLFAQEGANVTITGRNSDRLEETRQLLLKSGVSEKNINSVVADVTTASGQDQLINTTLAKFAKIDILINNAGASIPDATGATGIDQGIDIYQKTLQLNLQSVIEMTKKVKPHLIETKGEIVNISSIAGGSHAQPDFIYYSCAKSALDQFTRSSAIDLIKYGIRVNSVSPGVVATGFIGAAGLDNEAAKKFYKHMAAHKECIPAGVAGKPEDIANIILFLADRKLSSYIIGQSIVADGGSTLMMAMQFGDAM
ncbi:hypothetical protein GCK72_019247 [Caenorhabditis remanei]|uniref:Uncharacterized protein n=1 Tax=Caenorhabditis remanei TaxID=31234 RepID=A0A6A5GDZ7_CAERE|nr:hypothetical protein GCK72_019247 [Caenorhabditis remanei]KAF1752692.1 hypothetical protein GCK72_019247 [Caenorhabditis remanei]